MKTRLLSVCLLIAVGLGWGVPRASAILVPLDGSWVIADESKDSEGGLAFTQTWNWESVDPVELCVSDLYVPGDVFEVYLNGRLLGPTNPFDSRFLGAWADTPEDAILDGAFSYAKWLLDPGVHSLTIRTVQRPSLFSADPSTVGFTARVVPRPVPEGGTSVVFAGMSIAGLIALRKRTFKQPGCTA